MVKQNAENEASHTVCVIGGGLIGLFCALALQDHGKKVILIENGQIGGRQGASFGNGCWINPGSIMPISLPGLWKQVPGFLLNPDGPFTIRWKHLTSLSGWLLRFVWAGRSWEQIEKQIVKRLPLLENAIRHYQIRAKQAGVEHLIRPSGLMYIYRNREELDNDAYSWALRTKYGIKTRFVEAAELRTIEPALSSDYQYGMILEEAATLTDPSAFCAALGQLFIARGGECVQGQAEDFKIRDKKLQAITVNNREIPCAQAVIAAGIWSKTLAEKLGDHISMVSERGYHITISDPDLHLNHSLMPADGKMAVVMTSTGLRLAGQVELASIEAPPRWQRAKIQLKYALRLFPQLKTKIDGAQHDVWMGHRPSTPDGLPVIDRSKASPDIVYAFGHSHTGVTMAPATAILVARLLNNDSSADMRIRDYSARRF